jgi:hypothetical protein
MHVQGKANKTHNCGMYYRFKFACLLFFIEVEVAGADMWDVVSRADVLGDVLVVGQEGPGYAVRNTCRRMDGLRQGRR